MNVIDPLSQRETNQQNEASKRRLQGWTALHNLSIVAEESTEEGDLYEKSIRIVAETFYPDHCEILLFDPTSGILRLYTSDQQLSENRSSQAPVTDEGIDWIAKQGKSIRVNNSSQDHPQLGLTAKTKSVLCTPVKLHQEVIGAINIESLHLNRFNEDDEYLMLAFAGHLATAIHRIRLFKAEQRRASELETLHQASLRLTSSLELPPVLQAILENAVELVSATSAHIFLYDGDQLTFGTALWALDRERVPDIDQQSQDISFSVAQSGKRIVVSRTEAGTFPKDNAHKGTLIGLPLRLRNEVIGVMNVSFDDPKRSFDEHELRILELLADQAAIAIDNARMYTESQHRAQELATAVAQREELVRLKNEFIQNISHELRTPLAITRGYSDLLLGGELGNLAAEQENAIAIISRRVNMLIKLVDDLIAILETEATQVKKLPVDLVEIIRIVAEDFTPTIAQIGVKLAVQYPPYPVIVDGNSSHLTRMLDNLVGNAIKYTPIKKMIYIKLETDNDYAVLNVADEGAGIPPEKLGLIFKRFYQVDVDTKRKFGGVGLGLSLVKEIAEAHGGSISVQSEPDKGSTFTIRLPLEKTYTSQIF